MVADAVAFADNDARRASTSSKITAADLVDVLHLAAILDQIRSQQDRA